MRRFYLKDLSPASKSVELGGQEFIHLKKVLRLKTGDSVAVFNGEGIEASGVIESIGTGSARINITGSSTGSRESGLELVLLQGLLKGEKQDFVIQKAVELGCSELVVYTNERTVPVLKAGRVDERLKRWEKTAIEAAKQCGRTALPKLRFSTFKEALTTEAALKLIFWEEAKGGHGLKDALKGFNGKRVAAMTGPEGGFSFEEVEAARAAGFMPAGLGPRILRAETAAITVLSILQYELGDLG